MNKPIIGIISFRDMGEENRPFTRKTGFTSLVSEKISSFGGIPLGILFPYGKFDDSVIKLCDGLVFQGGSRIELCQILAMKYAVDKKIPILGICNGMQTMVGFDYISQKVTTEEEIASLFNKYGEDYFLEDVLNHNKENPFFIQNIDKSRHNVNIDEDSKLYKYYGTSKESFVSLHNSACKKETLKNPRYFKICALSDDGVIEGIESIDNDYFAIGVQYHIEIDNLSDKIFKDFIESCNK